ncbi:uncharacterized protein LOC120342944 [Styela clava]
MNFKFLALLLLIALLTIDSGDAWGRRRRRGRRGGWFRRVVRGVGGFVKKGIKFYKRHKSVIHKVGGAIFKMFGDNEALENLATLKNQDLESYGDFMDNLKSALEENYPDQDSEDIMQMIDDVADMKKDERAEFMSMIKEEMENVEHDPLSDQVKEELSMRIANLE